MNTPSRPLRPAAWGEFLALPENRSALRAARGMARAVLAGKRSPSSPLVLHGAPGTGKSHLANTLIKHVTTAPNGISARSVSVGDLARAAVDDATPGFNDPDLQTCELLVLEDVQLIPPRAIGPLCELLDARGTRRGALVVTANTGPAGLGHLPRKLTSRLSSGLVLQLEALSPLSRRIVLESAARARHLRLTDDTIDWLATQTTGGGIRVLLGWLSNLALMARNYPGPLDRNIVQSILTESGQPTSTPRDVPEIVKRVAAEFAVSERELLGRSRLRRVMLPRQVAMYLARQLCGLSLPRLGAAFARDHTTVLHACQKIASDLENDATLQGRVRHLQHELT